MPKASGWWQVHFRDHPERATKPGPAWAGDKVKTYCIQCLEQHVAAIQKEYDDAVLRGINPVIPRETSAIETHLYSLKATTLLDRGWRRSASSTLLNHLATCPYQPPQVKADAKADPACTSTGRTLQARSASKRGGITPPDATVTMPYSALPNIPQTGSSTGPGTLAVPPGMEFSAALSGTPSAMPSPLLFSHPFSLPLEFGSGRSTPSLAPSDSISQMHHSSASTSQGSDPTRRLSRSNLRHRPFDNPVNDYMHWSSERQQSFENRLGRLTASAGLPLSWVDNPEWVAFVDEFVPAAVSPSRKTLSRRIIPKLVKELQDQVKKAVYGQNATMQANGWTGENHHHMITLMITVNGKLYTVKVHDASAERKTADNLLRLLEEVFQTVQNEWGAVVVAIVTDASGESRKARRDFVKPGKYPWVIVLDCYAHQVNLVVGDYFKVDSDVLKYTDAATDLITWLRGKTLLLALIREEQLKTSGITSAIIRAVLTRWTTHLRAYERLLSLRNVLRSVALTDSNRPESQIVIGDRAAKAKATKMLELIDNGIFWQSLARVVRHLRPLGIAANVIQDSFCRIDTVLLTFGHLLGTYLDMTDPEDLPGCRAIIESIERRWAKTDQELFIAAIILNPVYQTLPFASIPQFRLADIVAMMTRLWRRFLRADPPDTFAFDLLEYLGKRGDYSNLDVMCNIEKNRADRTKTIPEPMNIFQAFLYAGKPDPPLILFARRILSVSANAASCERLFSAFGATLTKLRNRLGVSLLTQLTELKMHIRDEHLRDKTAKARLKRRFQPPKGPAPGVTVSSNTNPPVQPNLNTSAPPPTNPQSVPAPSISVQPANVIDPVLTAQTAPTNSNSGFRALIQQEVAAVTLDDLDNDPLFGAQSGLTTYPLIPISKLFDFSNKHWSAILTKHGQHTFEEELALYELLDLDADGEDDVDVDFDETTEQMLLA